MTDAPILIGASVILRPPRPGDVAERLALGNDLGIMHMFGADPTDWPPLTEARAAHWVEEIASHAHVWVVEHDGRLLGLTRLDALDRNDARARMTIGLYDPAKLGMGLGRDAIRTRYGTPLARSVCIA